jgi:carboxymethylenebutenolidase
MISAPDEDATMESAGLTRRQALKVGAATFVGYAVGVDKALAQAIKTDTTGIVAGDYTVKIGDHDMPVYEARPASATNAPIVLAISEVFGVHEWVKDVTRRFAKAGYCCVAPELFQREGGVGQLPNVQDVLKIVFAVPRKQLLGDVAAAADWAKTRPGVLADRIAVTGWCWGGGVVYQVAATHPDIKAAVAWYGPLRLQFPDSPNPLTGFDVAKDIKAPFLGLYGENDQNPTPAEVQRFVDMLKPHNPTAEAVVYPGAGHAFFADYRPSYNAAAAADGWKRCLAHFDKHLKT